MKTQINGTKSDISAMLLSAERYALGRQTYIVDWTCEFISNNLHLILERDKKVMIRDIKEQEKNKFGNCLVEFYENELADRDIKILQELLGKRK